MISKARCVLYNSLEFKKKEILIYYIFISENEEDEQEDKDI